MALAEVRDDIPLELAANALIELPGGAVGYAEVEAWSEGERNSVGLFTIEEQEGEVGPSTLRFNGVVVSRAFENAPTNHPAPRRLLPKSVVLKRVHDTGKFNAVMAVMDQDRYASERWRVPDAPNVYADDETLLFVLDEAGLTAGEIAVVTASE